MVDEQKGGDAVRADGREAENATAQAGPTTITENVAAPAGTRNRLLLTTASAAVLSLVMIGSLALSSKTPSFLHKAGEQAVTAIPAEEPDSQATLSSPDQDTSATGFKPGSPEQWQSAHIERAPKVEPAPATETPAAETATAEAPAADTSDAMAALDPKPTPEASETAPALRNVPLPMPRPPEFRRQTATAPTRRPERRNPMVAAAPAPIEDTRSFFDKLLGIPTNPPPALAYAALETKPTLAPIAKPLAPMTSPLAAPPVTSLPAPVPAPAATPATRSGGNSAMIETKPPLKPLITAPVLTPRAGGGTAVYDITAKVVTLPSGERLEAHSGIGETMDDPRYVYVSMRGATPPGTYDLTERERPFHGVRALRMHPVGGSAAVHGRVGLLTHSYLRGPSGASSGCVSFRDYNRFLQAYLRGEVTRIVVVPGSGGQPLNPISNFMNKLFGGA